MLSCVGIAAPGAPSLPGRITPDGDEACGCVGVRGNRIQPQRQFVYHGKAKSHLSQKLKYFEERRMVQTAEQFIEVVASGSRMSAQPYLVRCGDSAPVQSGQWPWSGLKDLRSVTRAKSTP